jgi:arylsulfatase A-like enzyme
MKTPRQLRTHTRVVVTISLALFVQCCDFAESVSAEQTKPNIVFVLADDLGWADTACMGSKYYHTPNIDRLAAQGRKFTNFHMCQNCAPTRACLMSGQYAPRTGVYTVGTLARGKAKHRKMIPPENVTKLPLDCRTIADQLKAAGYITGMFGKWHLGNDGDYHPAHRGFDEAIVVEGNHFKFHTNPPEEISAGSYDGDWITDRAVEFIEEHQQEPFFLYVPHRLVHTPLQAKPGTKEKYEKTPPDGDQNNPVYAAMIESVDDSVGRIMAKLDQLGLAGSTVFLFSSDNGGIGSYREPGANNITDNGPLHGGKGQLYEGGLRVPLIVRWPGVVAPGTTSDALTAHVDIYPTLLDIGNAQRPAQPLDGVSLIPVLRGDPSARLGRDAIYGHFPGYLEGYGKPRWRTTPASFIIAGDWKLLEFHEDGHLELYNLRDDVSEIHNLAFAHPGRVEALHQKLVAWREDVRAAMPVSKTDAIETVLSNGDGKK